MNPYFTTGAPPMGGDADALDGYVSDYDEAAETIRAAAQTLTSLSDDAQFVSLAIDEVRERITEGATETDQIAVRFEGAAAALADYAIHLRDAKAAAAGATSSFTYAIGRFDYWSNEERDLTDQIAAGDSTLVADLTYATGRRRHWQTQITAAENASAVAFADLDTAARAAITAIDAAMAASTLNDSWGDDWNGFWEGVYEWCQEYLAPVLQVIMEIADLMSTIVGWVAFAVAVLGVFFPILAPLAGVLALVALGFAVLSFLCAGVLTLLGKMTTVELGERGFKLAIQVVLSAVGLGGVTDGLTKAGTAALANAIVPAGPAMSNVVTVVVGELMDVLLKQGVSMGVDAGSDALYDVTPMGSSEPEYNDLYPDAGGPDWNVPPLPEIPTLAEMQNGATVVLPEGTALLCTATD